MGKIEELSSEEIIQKLNYLSLVLIAFELFKGLIIAPIRSFYKNTTITGTSFFHSYDQDVLSRHKEEFEACLLYLRDFMKAIDDEDYNVIQEFIEHRNILAHNIVSKLSIINHEDISPLLEKVKNALYKLSKHQIFVEISADPEFKDIYWNEFRRYEYILFKKIIKNIKTDINIANLDNSTHIESIKNNNTTTEDVCIIINTKYPPQKCSYCKGLILHPDDRKDERIKGECNCDKRGEYYMESYLKSDHSGTQKLPDDDNYSYTRNDQEHFF